MKVHPQTFRYILSAMALLLALASCVAAPAIAQPSFSDEDLGQIIEEMGQRLSQPDVRARVTRAQWDVFSDNLEKALACGHEGVQQGALRMIIFYGDNLSISRAGVYDAVRIYRNHEDDRLRRMAVVALGKIQDPWGLDMLKRSARFEKSPRVRHTILAVLGGAEIGGLGPAKVGT
jgi:hypothetical protein